MIVAIRRGNGSRIRRRHASASAHVGTASGASYVGVFGSTRSRLYGGRGTSGYRSASSAIHVHMSITAAIVWYTVPSAYRSFHRAVTALTFAAVSAVTGIGARSSRPSTVRSSRKNRFMDRARLPRVFWEAPRVPTFHAIQSDAAVSAFAIIGMAGLSSTGRHQP